MYDNGNQPWQHMYYTDLVNILLGNFAVGTVGLTGPHKINLRHYLFSFSREKGTTHKHDDFLSLSSTNNLLFSACRVIPPDPAQAMEEVTCGERRVEGSRWDGGGSRQKGGEGRLAAGGCRSRL